jgi:hypothetical protein
MTVASTVSAMNATTATGNTQSSSSSVNWADGAVKMATVGAPFQQVSYKNVFDAQSPIMSKHENHGVKSVSCLRTRFVGRLNPSTI